MYENGQFGNKFSDYEVDHADEDKFNNHPSNLKIVFYEQYKIIHGKVIYYNGQKYYRLVPENRRREQTRKAILIGGHWGQWYPKSQLITRNGYIYASEWIYRKKRFK